VLVFPDTSEFQRPVDASFNRDVLSFRVMFGNGYLDPKFLANANEVAKLYSAGKISGAILYTVYLGNQSVASQYAATWKAIGPTAPPWLLGIMIDVERWGGQSYAISGNHSTQLNQLFGMHAHKMGHWNGCIGYGNSGDLASIWPQRDPRCHVIVASYGASLTYKSVRGAIGQQYTDGQTKWGVPSGLPTSTPPFGSCDHNVLPGFKDGAALRASMRPAAAKPVAKPVAKPAANPHPYPLPTGGPAGSFVDATGNARFVPLADGRVQVLVNHQTIGYITPQKG
jgi:hypothetical protein